MRRILTLLTIAAVCSAGWVTPSGAAETAEATEASNLGRQIAGFKLHDFRGKVHSLDDYADAEVVVVAFLGVDCPLVKLYAPRLQALADKYAEQGVAVIAINSNYQDSIVKMNGFSQRHEIKLPMLKDPDNSVADQFGAKRTPEVFVLDRERVVRYNGRIDDQFGIGTGSAGYAKYEISRYDLAEALDELLAGKEVSVAQTPTPGCLIGRVPRVEPHGDITYTNQIARILQNRCVECHRDGEVAPFALTEYDDVVGWAEMMCEVVNDERMPPWFADANHGKFANDSRLTPNEKLLLNQWVENGCPQGDLADLPEPVEYAQGWAMPEPDEVYYMPESYTVPADGVVDYQYFSVDPGWTEDKWIVASEARPGNRQVVHHIICFVESNEGRDFSSRGGMAGYAPGLPPQQYPAGMAMKVPAGSKITFQMHYTPCGTEQVDRSYVGLKFCKPEEVTKQIKGAVSGTLAFAIPPHHPNYEVTSRYRVREDALLLSMTPHMHVRGKAFKFEAEYPDGTREVLLNVPRYDFNWQLRYDLAEPKLIPGGTKIHCTAHFDNSEDNLANPDPDSTVRFGDQTFEEMMFGFFTLVDPNQDLQKEASELAKAASTSAGD